MLLKALGNADNLENPFQVRALLQPKHQAVISSDLPARIKKLSHYPGDRFKKGDLLVAFDCSLFHAQLALAQTDLKGAQKKHNNLRKRAELRSVGVLEVELAQVDVDKARARVQVARVSVNHCRIKAPFSGRVVQRRAQQHERVKVGDPLLDILDDTALEIQLVVPSRWLRWLKPGTPFQLKVDETDRIYQAVVNTLGAHIDPVSQSLKITGSFKKYPQGLLSGMSGSARFEKPTVLERPSAP